MSDVVVPLLRPDSDLPAPLTAPDCDLRGYEFMPLYGNRLFSSDFDAHASDAEFRAAVMLWWTCWQQRPAASLPDDDAYLAKAAGFGRDRAAWMEVRNRALHGFVKCSDGRLYHAVLAEEAAKAWRLRQANSAKRARHADRMAEWRRRKDEGGDDHVSGTDSVTAAGDTSRDMPRDTSRDGHPEPQNGPAGTETCDMSRAHHVTSRTGQDSKKSSVSSLRSDTDAVASSADQSDRNREPPPPVVTADPKTRLFREALPIAMGLLRAPEPKVRALLGKWLKAAGDDAAMVHDVILDAAIECPADPVPWIMAAVKSRVQVATHPPTGTPRAGSAEGAEAVLALGTGWRAAEGRPRPWFASLAKADKDREGVARWCYGGAIADLAENRFLEAAKLSRDWPGDLRLLAEWLTEGWRIDVVCRVVADIARRDGYSPPRSLKFFDAAIRATRKSDERF